MLLLRLFPLVRLARQYVQIRSLPTERIVFPRRNQRLNRSLHFES